MAPTRTRTVKNKHAANKSGIKNSKDAKRSHSDGVVKPRSNKKGGAPPPKQVHKSSLAAALQKKMKKKTWTDEELGIPKLNAITPVGVVKPKGKKKGKVFVDDPESMRTILAIVQAEKEGQIESKIMKARQMEEIREARRVEAEKKEEEKKSKLEDAKDSLRKKRKRNTPQKEENIRAVALTGSKAAKPKPKKKVSFA